ncbi:MAG TPA: TadE/TadG family type IV pilus assembly protein [Paraburkholderia sp.]|nr:TadE/TadG family type IV pilus assembly protein [Paraburkholderia sp.]
MTPTRSLRSLIRKARAFISADERACPSGSASQRTHHARHARARWSAALRADDGVVAIELAVLLPLILLMLLGFTEIYLYLRAVSIVERTAFTLVDTIGQKSSVNDTNTATSADNLGAYWNATNLIATPLDMPEMGEVILTSICDNTSNCGAAPTSTTQAPAPAILWQRLSPANGAKSPSQKSRLGTSLVPATWPFRSGDSAFAVEVFYSFNPFTMTSAVWANAPGTIVVYEVAFARPRWNVPVALVPA